MGNPASFVCLLLASLAMTGSASGAPAPAWNPDHELGRPFIRAYSPREYNGHSQVFGTGQDSRGVLYAANSGGVLEYDGARWRRVAVPGTTFLYGLSIATDDVIYIGGIGQIGMIRDNAAGEKEYVSLLDRLPAGELPFTEEVWEVNATPEGVFFGGMRKVFRWRNGKFDVWKPETESVIYDFWTGSRYFVQGMGRGLHRLDGDEMKLVSDDPALRAEIICGMADWDDDTVLIATKNDGLHTLGPRGFERFPTDVDAFIKEEVLNKILHLSSGDLALGTFNGGVVIVNREGRFVRLLDEATALPNQTIAFLSEDREGGLWCSLGSGIARVALRSPSTLFDRSNGLRSVLVWCMERHDNVFHLGTNSGLFRLLRPETPPGFARFELVPGMQGEVTAMISFPEGLLAAYNRHVVFIAGELVTRVASYDTLVYELVRSDLDPNRVFVGHTGVGALRFVDGAWFDEGGLPGVAAQVRSVVEEGDGTIWLGTAGQDAYRVENFGASDAGVWDGVRVTRFGEEAGISEGAWITPYVEDGKTFFETDDGLRRFDEATNRFVPVEDPNPPRKPGGPWTWDHRATDGAGISWGTVYPASEAAHTFDVISGRQFRDGSGQWVWEDVPAELFDAIGMPRVLMMEEVAGSKILWVGGFEGLLRWDLAAGPRGVAEGPFSVLLRRAGISGGETIYAGSEALPERVTIDHTSQALRFEFATPVFVEGVRPVMETRLEGYESEWMPADTATAREFTNLSEGRYRFHVRASNTLGQVAEARTFVFWVRPPWYRTWWSYGGYVLLGFAGMAGTVRWRLAAIRRENERLERIIAERTEDLREACDEADRANRAKSMFLANMSHELRTPLNGILGYTQILQRDSSINRENRQRLRVLQSSGEHLLRLINEVLDLSKIESGRIELHRAPAELRSIVNAVCSAFRPRIQEKALEFIVEVDASLPERVIIDEQKFSQVLFNLLGNAVIFTEHGRVELRVSALEDGVRIEVIDTGVGIPPEEQALIFQPFQQAASRPLQADGTGLGLTICSRIVALMGGQLQVGSLAGRGSRFWFDVPLEVAGEAAGRGDLEVLVTGYSGPRRRVLVVDDVAINRSIVREMLDPLGFTVAEAPGGDECLLAVEKAAPDLILLDLRMAPMSGAEVVRRLRASEAGRTIKVVSFSASTMGFTREDAHAIGCDDYLPKPFREEELLEVLQRQLDLTWERKIPTDASDGHALPDAAEARELLAYARRGDATGLRTALKKLAKARPEVRGFVEELDRIAAGYRMREVRTRLEKLSSSRDT